MIKEMGQMSYTDPESSGILYVIPVKKPVKLCF